MNHKIIKNVSWLLIGNIFKTIFQFVLNILIARALGPTNIGKINYITTYTTFFLSLVGLGLDGVIIYELVNSDKHGEIIGTASIMRLFVGLLSSILMIFIITITENQNNEMIQLAVLQAIQLPFSAFDTIRYWYQYKLESKRIVLVTALGYVISSIYKVFVLITQKGILWFGFCSSLDVIVISALFLLSISDSRVGKLSFSKETASKILHACLPFLLSNIMALIYSKVDTIMIRYMIHSMEAIGFYTTSITICGYIGFIPAAIIASARPIIMEEKRKGSENYYMRMRQLSLSIIIVNVVYSFVVSVFGKTIILMLYGESYLGALSCLRVAVWFTAFSHLGTVKNLWLICEKKNNYVFLFATLGAITNIILNSLMIPRWSIVGAAMATLLTQLMTNLIFPFVFSNTREFVLCIRDAILLKK